MLKNLIMCRQGTGWLPNELDPRDWNFDSLGLQAREMPAVWSLRKWVPQVLSQGATSSCTAHAFAGAIGVLESQANIPYLPVSRLFIYYNARKYASDRIKDSGSSIRYAAKGMAKFGVPDEKYWPFSMLKINSQPTWNPQRYAWHRRGGEYYVIPDLGAGRVMKIKLALLEGYPVVFGTPIGETFKSRKGSYLIDKPRSGEEIVGGHALLIIGYVENSEGLSFEILNSWGDSWRDHGYAWLSENYIRWSQASDFTIIRGWEALKAR